jgi:hypothetical protein
MTIALPLADSQRTSTFDFPISQFRFELVALDSVVMPRDNKGNVLRGAFGTIFKDLCCGAVVPEVF